MHLILECIGIGRQLRLFYQTFIGRLYIYIYIYTYIGVLYLLLFGVVIRLHEREQVM